MTESFELEHVIRGARAGEVAPVELFRALSTATLLLAGAPNEDGAFAPQVISWEGVDYAAVFTSQELTRTLPDAVGFAEMTGRDLGATWPNGLGAAVNPGSDDVALVFDSEAMRMLASPDRAGELGGGDAPRRESVAAGETVSIGAPADPPAPEFYEAVRANVRALDGVESAYVFQMVDGTQTPRLMVGAVLVPGTDERASMTALANAVVAAHPPAAGADFMVLGVDLRSTVSNHVEELT